VNADLVRWIEDTYNLKELARTPIFLHMIIDTAALIMDMNIKKTVSSTVIYRIYIRNWIYNNLLNTHSGIINEEQAFSLLAGIAYHMYVHDTDIVKISFFNEEFLRVTGYEAGFDAWRSIHGSAFLNLHEDKDMARFSHESFREYFTAFALASDLKSNVPINCTRYCKDYWTEQVDAFLLGEMDDEMVVDIFATELLHNDSINTRMNCAITIGRWPNNYAIEILSNAMDVEIDIGVAGRIAEALFARGREEHLWRFLSNIERYCSSSVDTGKEDKCKLLYDIQTDSIACFQKDIQDVVKETIQYGIPRLAKYCIYVSGRLGLFECRRIIEEKYANANTTRMKLYIVAALGRIGDTGTVKRLMAWKRNERHELLRSRIDASLARLKYLQRDRG
ncbi:MAG: hypothetical protein WAW23_09330, partial [Candidatus Methanoperedens sp.]